MPAGPTPPDWRPRFEGQDLREGALREAIVAFIEDARRAEDVLRRYLEAVGPPLPPTLANADVGRVEQIGDIPGGGRHFFHGLGCAIEIPGQPPVDIDWTLDGTMVVDAWKIRSWLLAHGAIDLDARTVAEAMVGLCDGGAVRPTGWWAEFEVVARLPIETRRLRLRPLTTDDAAAVFAVVGDEVTTERVSWRQPDLESTQRWVAQRILDHEHHGLSMWAVEVTPSPEIVGLVGFFPGSPEGAELGYVVRADQWRRGIAAEAVAAALAFARSQGVPVFASIRSTNEASLAVARRCGLAERGSIDDERGTLLIFRA